MTYTESNLVEQPAIQLFAELGWETLSASDEVMGASGTLGRETKSEVVLAVRLRNVLVRLNPSLPSEAISAAVVELSRDRSAMLPAAAMGMANFIIKGGNLPCPLTGKIDA